MPVPVPEPEIAALLALGASLTFERVRGHFWHASAAALVRVAVGPAAGWTLALILLPAVIRRRKRG